MAQMNKPTDDDKAWFDDLLPTDPDVVRKPMFGPTRRVCERQHVLCLFGSRVAVRLGEAERNDLLDGKGARKAVARSLAYARTLPPKVKK